jgi:hypothetical protein
MYVYMCICMCLQYEYSSAVYLSSNLCLHGRCQVRRNHMAPLLIKQTFNTVDMHMLWFKLFMSDVSSKFI